MKKEKRFVSIYNESSGMSDEGQKIILVDMETGVNYLWVHSGYAGGLTPLLDCDGKAVVSKLPLKEG